MLNYLLISFFFILTQAPWSTAFIIHCSLLNTPQAQHRDDSAQLLARMQVVADEASDSQRDLRDQVSRLTAALSHERDDRTRALDEEKRRHAQELDALDARIRVLVARKDAQAASLREQLQVYQARLAETHQVVESQRHELKSLLS
jgi:hypothetical protein